MDLYQGRKLPQLLDELAEIKQLERIRLMYTYPNDFPIETLDAIARHDNICNYIDIPFQHISDRILKSMRRSFTADDTRKLIDTIRAKVPDIAIRSTFITGFPSETDAEFRMLYDFLEEVQLDRVGVFTYSHEENTPAYSLSDDVPEDVKNERRNALMEMQQSISLRKNEALVGTEMDVVVDELDKKTAYCRSYADAPEVDNCVIVKNAAQTKPGDILKVRISRAEPYDLHGKII